MGFWELHGTALLVTFALRFVSLRVHFVALHTHGGPSRRDAHNSIPDHAPETTEWIDSSQLLFTRSGPSGYSPELQGTGEDQSQGQVDVSPPPPPHEALDPKGCDVPGDRLSQHAHDAVPTPRSLDPNGRQTLEMVLRFSEGRFAGLHHGRECERMREQREFLERPLP